MRALTNFTFCRHYPALIQTIKSYPTNINRQIQIQVFLIFTWMMGVFTQNFWHRLQHIVDQ
jgi:hypothetical protein